MEGEDDGVHIYIYKCVNNIYALLLNGQLTSALTPPLSSILYAVFVTFDNSIIVSVVISPISPKSKNSCYANCGEVEAHGHLTRGSNGISTGTKNTRSKNVLSVTSIALIDVCECSKLSKHAVSNMDSWYLDLFPRTCILNQFMTIN